MEKESNLSMMVTFVLLLVAIFAYVLIDKYLIVEPGKTEKEITSKTKDDTLSEDDAIKLGKEKYYIAVATITNTKSDIDKLYNMTKTKDIILTDQSLIDKLNEFNVKTYTPNSQISVISNYGEAISNNFTDDFINNNILLPSGFISSIDDVYYILKDKIDNYFFKEATLSLISSSETELHFKVVNTNYDTSCVQEGQTVPSITCTKVKDSDPYDFKMVKENKKWKVSQISLITS